MARPAANSPASGFIKMPPIPLPIALYLPVDPLSLRPCIGGVTTTENPSYTPSASSCLFLVIEHDLTSRFPHLSSCFHSTGQSCDFVHLTYHTGTVDLGRIVQACAEKDWSFWAWLVRAMLKTSRFLRNKGSCSTVILAFNWLLVGGESGLGC
jgi:hypothetical protein